MDLSFVTQKFSESVIREMTRVARQHPGCINLAQGFPDFPAPDVIKSAAIKAINEDYNQYSITWGTPNLRNAIAQKVKRYNGIMANPEKNITVTCGSTEAMISSLTAIINPGDEVIIFEPFYENYGPDCLLCGAKPKYVSLTPPEWTFDYDALERAFTPKTKAIIINTPNNPTGKVFSEKELQFIANLCIQHDVIAVTDEIYEHIYFDGARHISIASLPDMAERSIIINSISKTYSVTGWRVGWAIASERITAEIKKVHDFLTVGAAHPMQEAAAYALTLDDQFYIHLQDFYRLARDRLFNVLSLTPLHPIKPNGAYYMMTECRDFMKEKNLNSAYELAMWLVKNIGIATVPGSSFYANPDDGKYYTRFCFCKKDATLSEAELKLKKLSSF
jgi:aminotransferase